MKKIAVLPTLVTLCNGVCGFIAVAYLLHAAGQEPSHQDHFVAMVCWLILAAMIFDVLDGSVARLTRQTSSFGAQLDSLSDVISFGLAPAAVIIVVAQHAEIVSRVSWAAGLLFLVCAMLRLARYNVESEEHEGPTLYFAGLPTPAAAGLIASLALLRFSPEEDVRLIVSTLHLDFVVYSMARFLPGLAVIAALAMVSRLPYQHVINRMVHEREPFHYVVRIVVVGLFIFLAWPFSIPLAFSVYVFSGVIGALHRNLRDRVNIASPDDNE